MKNQRRGLDRYNVKLKIKQNIIKHCLKRRVKYIQNTVHKSIKKYKNEKKNRKLCRIKSSNTKEFWCILNDGKDEMHHLTHYMNYTKKNKNTNKEEFQEPEYNFDKNTNE